MGGTPKAYLLGSLIHQESCPKCWDPKSVLSTSREYGAGLGQLTKAYTSTGAIRFDALSEIRTKHRELYELTWNNILSRPDLQIRSIILKMRDNYQHYENFTDDPLAFADSAYNSGIGSVDKKRRTCQLTAGCNPKLWFGNVENICLTGSVALYGKRTACDINTEHVHNVLILRASAYKKAFDKLN